MKRWIGISGLLLACVFALSACETGEEKVATYQGKTGEQTYAEIMRTFERCEDNYTLQVSLQTDMKGNSLGQKMDQTVVADLTYKRAGDDESFTTNIRSSGVSAGYDLEITAEESAYYVGGIAYQYSLNNLEEPLKRKKRVTKADYPYADMDIGALPLPSSIFEGAFFTVGKSEAVLRLEIDATLINQGFEGLFDIIGSLTEVEGILSAEMSDMVMEVHLDKDGQFKYMSIAYTMQAGIMGGLLGTSSGNAYIRFSAQNIGSTTVTPPAEAENYPVVE